MLHTVQESKSQTNPTKTSKSKMIVIFVTVFVDLIGFGMIIPLTPYLATDFGASPFQVGLLMASFSLTQFLFSPIWGRWSDRIGRRPIMLASLMLSAVSYLGFSFSTNLYSLFFWRLLAGAGSANISTAMAYIADITPPEGRSKGMGLIGAAFGLGFIFGPVFGGLLSDAGQSFGTTPPFGIGFSALGASLICFLNFLVATQKLEESLTPELRKNQPPRIARWDLISQNFKRPVVGILILIQLLSGLAMAHMESTLGLFVKDVFGWQMREASFAFAFVGVMMVITQGYLVRKLMPKFGERKLLAIGLILAAIGIGGISISTNLWTLGIVIVLLAMGIGFTNPSILGSISLLTPANEQGSVMGLSQSVSALGRILGPGLGGYLYGRFGSGSPFLVGGGMMLLGFFLSRTIAHKIPQTGKAQDVAHNSEPSSDMKVFPITKIERFQFDNILRTPMLYLLLDLRPPGASPVFLRAISIDLQSALRTVREKTKDISDPIVVFCEDGKSSFLAAEEIAKHGYKNVVYLEGGLELRPDHQQ